jgi:serine acetyltransferase
VDGRQAEVTHADSSIEKGVYAPFSKSGRVAVNGVVASAYASNRADQSHLIIAGVKLISMHRLAHVFQARHRLACALSFEHFCSSEAYVDCMSAWLEPT